MREGEKSNGRVLFVGGSGVISSACVQEAVENGMQVTVLNRGRTTSRVLPEGVEVLHADIRDREATRAVLGTRSFDTVAQFLGFTPEHVAADIEFFAGRTGQYIFVSSASAYQTPPRSLPVTESTPLRNPFWQYSRDKIACEDALVAAWREHGFPATIVRPSHTYDQTMIPTLGGFTDIARMLRGAPVIVHGDGSSLWTITHARDFAVAFAGVLGRPETLGEAYQITSDEAPTWDAIYTALAHAAGVEPTLVHVASESIARVLPDLGPGLLGDKAHSMVFDNSKIKALVPHYNARTPFVRGAEEIVRWHLAAPERQHVDAELDAAFERLVAHAAGF